MTVDELLARESIRHTLASYNMAGDRLRVDDFIAVFTEDGILESEGVPEKDAFRNVGRDEIRAWMTRWGRGSKDANPVHAVEIHPPSPLHLPDRIPGSGHGEGTHLLGGLHRYRSGSLRLLSRRVPQGRGPLADRAPQGAHGLERAREPVYVGGREAASLIGDKDLAGCTASQRRGRSMEHQQGDGVWRIDLRAGSPAP